MVNGVLLDPNTGKPEGEFDAKRMSDLARVHDLLRLAQQHPNVVAMADNVGYTPGTGATVAADEIAAASGIYYQRIKLIHGVDGVNDGDVAKTNPLPVDIRGRTTYVLATGNLANVAAARTTHVDIFNATGSGVVLKVMALYIIPTLTAVTGVGLTWEIIKSNTVGTGGTVVTSSINPFDTTDGALPAQVTARTKPTGGAATLATLLYPNTSSEETSGYATQATQINHIPTVLPKISGITLNEGEGIKLDQTLSSAVGSTNTVIILTTG